MVPVALYHDRPNSEQVFTRFRTEEVLPRLKSLDAAAARKGLAALDPRKNALIPLGMEVNAEGHVTKNSYGLFHLAWKAERDGDWADKVAGEITALKATLRERHGVPLRFVIWAGMGGSAEDKSTYNLTGLLKKGPRLYVLDSTDPAKLKAILADAQRRSGLTEAQVLKSTLVVGMAMGMTSYEPVINLEKLCALYQRHRIDSRPNFIYMTLPGSLLEKFAAPRGYRRVELQLDGGNATAGRHTGPLTRGSLYPLALAGVDLNSWIRSTFLDEDSIQDALRLAAFLDAQGRAGRDKVTLLLPRAWAGLGLWTKQNFEESLGKSEELGIKIVIGETPRLAHYRSPKDPAQDRVFLHVKRAGHKDPADEKAALIRRAGYPLAQFSLPAGAPLSAYMQFMHYVVFGIGYLRGMNFVTQPSVELYKAITSRLAEESARKSGVAQTEAWKKMKDPATTSRFRGGVALHFADVAAAAGDCAALSAPEIYARILRALAGAKKIDTAELTFFGDMRYAADGKKMGRVLDRAATGLFRSRLKMPADVYEGPAMNHSYHEMVIGHGKCFSTVVLSEKAESIPGVSYTADYHVCQFLATQRALAERGRAVVAITVKDLSEPSLRSLGEFFRQAAVAIRKP